jgi:cell division protein FtsB
MSQRFTLVLLILGSVLVLMLGFGDQSFEGQAKLRQQVESQRAETLALQNTVNKLRSDLHRFDVDPRAVEQVARDSLGMAKANDLVFVFDD